ncbi:MAG TPA: ATPase [Glaciihabitans sp.]|jgi:uncharacterized protein YndB with AHSA1/START domain|nr:ATPase [Glaciihabitans sp.]
MTQSIGDQIEHTISINADAERVWALIRVPGWFLNGGSIVEHTIEPRNGYVVVHDADLGDFPLHTVALDPPRYAAFRWFSGRTFSSSTPLLDRSSTLIEFWITPRGGNAVTLRVVESGFAYIGESAPKTLELMDENSAGWVEQLAVAKRHLETAN